MPHAIREAQSYHWSQVALHWLVAFLVALQFATGGSIERTHHAVERGLDPGRLDLVLHAVHNRTGLVIFGLMLIRLAMRLLVGAPKLEVADSGWQPRLACATHLGFYVVLLTQALTGAIASYFYWPISTIHIALSKVLLALIVLHALAALWHMLVKRGATMGRMIPLVALRNWRARGSRT